jgi:branched-chain amino acid transport system substrate-binding protein
MKTVRPSARKRSIQVAAVIGSCSLLISVMAACSSSKSGQSAAGSSSASAPSGTSITIAQVTSFPSAASGDFPEQAAGFRAAVEGINAAGGIKGHPLKASICPDHADINQSRTCAQDAISDSHVVAIVGQDSFVGGPVIDPLFEAAGLANVGLQPITSTDFSCTVCFPIGGGPLTEALATPLILNKKFGAKHIAMVTAPIAAAQQLVKAASTNFAAKVPGGQIEGTYISNGTVDLSSYIAKMKSSGVDAIFIFAGSLFRGVVKTADQLGFKVPLAATAQNVTSADGKTLGALINNVTVVGVTQPASADLPGAAQFRADMKKYAPGQQQDGESLIAWTAVQMFAAAAKTSTGDITRKSVLDGMTNMMNWNSGGIIPPYSTNVPWTGLGGSAPRVFDTNVIITKTDPDGKVTASGGFVSP